MNKQELIEKYRRIYHVSSKAGYRSDPFSRGEDAGSTRCSFEIIDDLKKLDEPQKVKVPAYVAEWFETNKYVLDRAILDYMFEDYASDNSEFGKWFDNKNGKPIETLVRMLDGYEVEEEPKYKVIMPNPQSKNGNVLVLRRTQQGTITVNKVKETTARLGEGMDLTEKEIKSVDERYWPFAVPAEKVEV